MEASWPNLNIKRIEYIQMKRNLEFVMFYKLL